MAAACPVKMHLWRGVAGLSLLVAAALVYSTALWATVLLVAFAAYFLRGCPVCWSFWLYEALRDKKRAQPKVDTQTPPAPNPQS